MAPLIRVGDTDYPVVMSPAEATSVLPRSEDTIRLWCKTGRLPVMKRVNNKEPYRILTGQLFAQLGIAYETVTEAVAS
jgi:predicted site-specific integrase-resolvase